MIDKITQPIGQLDLIDKTNEIIDEKQDALTAGTSISIVDVSPSEPVDTRSTASIVTVGSNRWQGVAYGNGVFVAVGNDGYVAYSSDGATWSTPTQVGTNSWYSITFANGKFVAVGNSGYTTTTIDGQTWTTPVQVSGLSQRLQQVRYGNGIFLAVGYDSKSTTSVDGQTWTTPVSIGGNGMAVVFDGSKFVATGRIGIKTTIDGTSWTYVSSTPIDFITAISYGNGTYVVGRDSDGAIYYSTNLTSWSASVSVLDVVESIYWTGTQFIAVGRRAITASNFKYSTITTTDGITWTTPVDIGDSASSSVIAYGFLSITSNGNGKFVAVGDSGATTTFEISAGQEGGTVISAIVDSTLSTTSTNPVQNKAVYNAIEAARSTITFRDWS